MRQRGGEGGGPSRGTRPRLPEITSSRKSTRMTRTTVSPLRLRMASIEATDDTFMEAGRVRVWTKADSVTSFAALAATPLP
jgi:hypothetical protein